MIQTQSMLFEGARGTKLFARSWLPDGTARAVLAVIHGFKAHSGLYDWPGQELAAKGIAVYAMDLRGNGKSEGERYHLDSFDDYMHDVDAFLALVRTRQPGSPVVLFGHSAGGVIATSYALDHQTELAGLISASFAYRVGVPAIGLALLKGLAHVAPNIGVLSLEDEGFSRDPAFVERMKNDPLIVHTAGPTQTIAEMARANDRLEKNFVKLTMPVLILHGTADRVTVPAGSQEFYDHASSTDKTLRLYEGHFHDLFNDVGREIVMAEVSAWIDAHAGAAVGANAAVAP